MKQVTLTAKTREGLGRTSSKKLRNSGSVPAVIYGESGTRHLTLDNHAFGLAWREISGRAALVEIKTEGDDESHFAIIQEAQRNTRTDSFLHIDFKEIVRGKDMEAEIPVIPRGTPHGVKNFGGVMEVNHDHIQVRCRPRNLPEAIEIDVSALEIGRSIHLNEVTAPEGVTFLDDDDIVVISCVGASSGASKAVDQEEAAAEGEEAEAKTEQKEEAKA